MTTEQPAAEPYSGLQLSFEIVDLVRSKIDEHKLDPTVYIGAIDIAKSNVSNALIMALSERPAPEEPGDAEIQSQN